MNGALFLCVLIPIIAGTSAGWAKVKKNQMTKQAFYRNTAIVTVLAIAGFLLLANIIKF